MNATAIDYIWKAIQESEQSDELQFMNAEMLTAAAAHSASPPRPDQAGAASDEPITEATIGPQLVNGDPLQTAPLPQL
jgi:hypothetical protein